MTVENGAMTFNQVEECLRTAKTEHEAKAARDAIEHAFTERDELKIKLENAEAANQTLRDQMEQQKIGFFNIGDHKIRAAIMGQLTLTAPKSQSSLPQPELSVQFDGGKVVRRDISLPTYGEMSIDDAEALVFALYMMVARARDHEPDTLALGA